MNIITKGFGNNQTILTKGYSLMYKIKKETLCLGSNINFDFNVMSEINQSLALTTMLNLEEF